MFTAKGFKLLFGVVGVVIAAVAASVMTAHNRRVGERRLREIDEGVRCISCDGSEVRRSEDVVTCQSCGHVASLGALRRANPSAEERAKMYRPDDWNTPDSEP